MVRFVAVSLGRLLVVPGVAISIAHPFTLALCRTIVVIRFVLMESPTIALQLPLVASDIAIDIATITTATIVIVADIVTAPPVPAMIVSTIIGASPIAAAMRTPVMVSRHHCPGTGQCKPQEPHCNSFHLIFSLDQNSASGVSRYRQQPGIRGELQCAGRNCFRRATMRDRLLFETVIPQATAKHLRCSKDIRGLGNLLFLMAKGTADPPRRKARLWRISRLYLRREG